MPSVSLTGNLVSRGGIVSRDICTIVTYRLCVDATILGVVNRYSKVHRTGGVDDIVRDSVHVGDRTFDASEVDCRSSASRHCAFLPQHRGREREDVSHRHAGIEKYFEEAFYPAVEGEKPRHVTPELIAQLMAASAKHGQTILPPAHS